LPALLAAGTAAGLAYVGSVSPYASGHYPACPIYLVTGLYCPGCGTLRSMHSLVNGDVAAAFSRNPLIPVLLVLSSVVFARWAWLRWRGRPLVWNPPNWVPIVLGVAVLGYGIARNLPGLEFLAP